MEHTTLRREQEDNNVESILQGKKAGQLPKQRDMGQGQYGLVAPFARAATDVAWKLPWSRGSGGMSGGFSGVKNLKEDAM
jgi:hypothetical protein